MYGFEKKLGCLVLAALLCCPAAIWANRISPAPPAQGAVPAQKNLPSAPPQKQPRPNQSAQPPAAAQPEAANAPQPGQQGEKKEQPAVTGQENENNPAVAEGAQDKAHSFSGIGNKREDATGEPLRIPKAAEKSDFLAGAWNFERAFIGQDGSAYRQDFIFNANGSGQAILRDANENVFVAEARAELAGNALRIVTGPFVDEKNEPIFAPEYIECHATAKGVECHGSDGFFDWGGERLLRDQSGLAFLPENHRGAYAEKSAGESEQTAGVQSGRPDMNGPETPEAGERGSVARHEEGPGQPARAQGQENYSELSPDGAELSPVIMENSAKARGETRDLSLANLAGHWRYSRDFARRDDGKSVALEFHFDRDGKGYSVINDGSGNEARANAEAMLTKNGQIRVRTDAYGNSFYPTFMECRPGSPDLICDVSNGWTRIENGKLVSIADTESRTTRDRMTEILAMPDQEERSVNNGEKGSSSQQPGIADILGDIPGGDSAQKSQTSGSQRSASTTSQPMVLPKNSEDTSFLQGRWRCDTGLVNVADRQPIVVEFSFNKNGEGSGQVRERSGTIYSASARASLRKGILRINTSDFISKTARTAYSKQFIECRDNGTQAICSGEGGGVRWDNATFTRLK